MSSALGFKPLFTKRRRQPLSSPALIDLVRAVHEKGAAFRFRAKGYSMHPAIKDGDKIVIVPPGEALPGIGDIAAFVQPETGNLIIHRIIERRGNLYLLKGDNAAAADGYVPAVNILGLVKVAKRRFPSRRLLSLLQQLRQFLRPSSRRRTQ